MTGGENMKGDLHIHSTISDGSYTFKEIIDMASERRLTHISFTNHDTVEGIKEAQEYGKLKGVEVIPGIEISAYDFKRKRKVHILGYNFNPEAPNIKKLCSPLLEKRNENSLWQAKTLIEHGYNIDSFYLNEKCRESGVLYKQHIMQALIKEGYTDKIYSPLYRKLFKNNGICDRDITYIDAFDAVRAVKEDKGIAVLAHPGQLNSYEIAEELICYGLDGIELNHPSHTQEDLIKIKNIAEKYVLILTGGSDFHGRYGEELNIKPGDYKCPVQTLKLLEEKI